MKSSLKYVVEEKDSGKKLREYLKDTLNFSSRFIRSAAREKRIRINNNVIKLNYIICKGEVIEIEVQKEESQNIIPEPIELEIIYEDEDIIVINKPPNMVVHPTRSHPVGTLANGLIYYFRSTGQKCIVRLVSRLDRDTSGLILIAKNQFAHMALARDMKHEEFKKDYLAITQGKMDKKQGTINLPIYKDDIEGIKRVIDTKGQKSITHYQVIDSFNDCELLKLRLETGRTHQIRVHLSYIGHPILGDTLYGNNYELKSIKRQALHACNLSFPHPRTGNIIKVEASLPEDMKKLIQEKRI